MLLIERRQAKRARELIDEHYRAVLRGFRIEDARRAQAPFDEIFGQDQRRSAEENVVRRDAVRAAVAW
jgi:hypothetical protein